MNIDRLGCDDKIVKVEGWAFVAGMNSAEDDIFIVLKSEGKAHVFVPDKRVRPEVATHFKNSDACDSGFFLGIEKQDLAPEHYKVGILIKSGKTYAFQYTDKIITIEPAVT
jgi:hypothetical protein